VCASAGRTRNAEERRDLILSFRASLFFASSRSWTAKHAGTFLLSIHEAHVLARLKNEAQYRDVRIMTHQNPVPVQVVRRDTFLGADDDGHSFATRSWNLATSMFYKAGHEPWRPADLPGNTCFVGISFHHLKRREGDVVYASVAQAFSNEIEPFALKGSTLPHEQRRDGQPYLNQA